MHLAVRDRNPCGQGKECSTRHAGASERLVPRTPVWHLGKGV